MIWFYRFLWLLFFIFCICFIGIITLCEWTEPHVPLFVKIVIVMINAMLGMGVFVSMMDYYPKKPSE